MPSRTMHRVTVAAVVVSYLCLTVLFTYPLVRAPATTIEWGWGDPLLVAYVLNWGAHALFRDPGGVFDAPFLHPTPNTLSLSEHLLSVSWPLAPLALLDRPLLFYNATVFASFFLSALVFFLYLRRLGCGFLSAWVGGVLFGFMPWRWGQLGHSQLLYTWWIALVLLAIETWIARPRILTAVGAGISFALGFGASVYHGFFFGFFLLVYLPLRLGLRSRDAPRVRSRDVWTHAAAGLGAALLVLAPSLLAYRRMWAALPTVNPLPSLAARGADVLDYLNTPSLSYLWGRFTRFDHFYSDVPWEMHAFPGTLAIAGLLLAPLLLWLRRKPGLPRAATAVPALAGGGFLCFLLSLGPVPHIAGRTLSLPTTYAWLHSHFPGFGALRVPARASFFVGLAGAALAAVALECMLRTARSARLGAASGFVAAAAALLDVAPQALPYRAPREYDRLRAAMIGSAGLRPSSGADLVFPVGDQRANFAAPLASLPELRPLVNGQSGYLPPANRRIFETLAKRPFGREQTNLLRDLKVTRIFLDREQVGDREERAILSGLSGSGGRPRSAGTWARYHVVLLSFPPAGRPGS